jgi:serine/threonine protein kinase
VFYDSSHAAAEYNTWSQVYNRSKDKMKFVQIRGTINQIVIGIHKLSYISMKYYPYTLKDALELNHVYNHSLSIFRDILIGLQQIHQLGLAHCDIKPENILLSHKLNPVIGDFGLVGAMKRLQGTGTRSFAAPEVFKECTTIQLVDY